MVFWAVLLLAAGAGRAETSVGAGASATAGSGGYRSISVSADADWQASGVSPYAWSSLQASRASRLLTAVGGAEKELSPGVRANAGAGFAVGRLTDTGTGGSLVLEAGAEKKLRALTAGAAWRLSAGSLAAPSWALGEDQRRREAAVGKAAGRGKAPSEQTPPSETYNELSGFARWPVSTSRLTLRLALGFPSYARTVVSETLSARIPATDSLSFSTGLTLEQSDASRVYVSAGFYYLFD